MKGVTRSCLGWRLHRSVVVLAMLTITCLFGSAWAVDWQSVHSPLPAGTSLYSVWGSGPNDVFVVGTGGRIAHYNGTWSSMNSGTTEDLRSVWGTASNNVYAVGGRGTILHFNGAAWSVSDDTLTVDPYVSIWGSGPSDIYVSGGSIMAHFDGTAWSSTPFRINNMNITLSGLWGTASNNIYGVDGSTSTDAVISRYDGTGWSRMSSGVSTALAAVWGSGPNDIWAVGTHGVMTHFNGSAWSAQTSPVSYWLNALWGTASNNVYAVGGYASNPPGGKILHYDGASWSQIWNDQASGNLYGVWGSGPNDIYAVGLSNTILHYYVANLPGTIQFSSPTYTVPAADGTATITVTRPDGTLAGVQVNYATSNGTAVAGTDYTAASDTLTFAANETSKTFPVAIASGGAGTVNLTLSNQTLGAALGSPSTAVLTITGAEAMPSVSVEETTGSGATLNFTVRLSAACSWPVTVDYATDDGTAVAGTDYTDTSGTLTIPAGHTTGSISVPVATLPSGSPIKEFFLDLSNPNGATMGTAEAVGTIKAQGSGGCGNTVGPANLGVFYALCWVGLISMKWGRRTRRNQLQQ